MTADPAEIARLTALDGLDIYGTLPEPTFDRVVELATSLLEVPIALLSFIGKDTLRVKARFGSALEALPRQESFCAFLIESDSDSLLVKDARRDPRFASLPLVTAGGIRFYFGLAIRVEGQPVGTLCVMDTQVRHLSSAQERSLRHLVALTEIGEIQGQRLGQVQADFTRAKQVLVNLLSNAIKYNRPHGEVRLHVCSREEETSPIKQWEIAVTDTGIGIDLAHLDHLFEPFNRLGQDNGSIEGTGIGLAIARELVERMGGSMRVESRLGEGSTFAFTLPAAPCDHLDSAEEP